MGLRILRTASHRVSGYFGTLATHCAVLPFLLFDEFTKVCGQMPEVLEKYMWSHTETGKSDVQRGNLSQICTPFECYIEVTVDASNVF